MDDKVEKKLTELKESVKCPKNYRCIMESIENICHAKYHALSETMECLDKSEISCEYSESGNNIFLCNCPLRKFIAINFEDISGLKSEKSL